MSLETQNIQKEEGTNNFNDTQEIDDDGESPDLSNMQTTQIKELFYKERERCLVLQRDEFKYRTKCHKLQDQIKKLQEINTFNAKNTNNTSSQFSLPSEFKEKWNELVAEKILDAFPDFLDKYHLLVPLIQELFILVRELLQQKQNQAICDIARVLNLFDEKVEESSSTKGKIDDKRIQRHRQALTMLSVKLQSVFQEHNCSIFKFSNKNDSNTQNGNTSDEDEYSENESIRNIILEKYKPRVMAFVEQQDEGEHVDDFVDNISSDEFIDFFKQVVDLQLHMFLNDPPIQMQLVSISDRAQKQTLVEQYDFVLYSKAWQHCIDGFHKDNQPAVTVLPQPLRQGYTYQSIKPAVLVFATEDFEEIFTEDQRNAISGDIARKQEELKEQQRRKEALKEGSRDQSVEALTQPVEVSSAKDNSAAQIESKTQIGCQDQKLDRVTDMGTGAGDQDLFKEPGQSLGRESDINGVQADQDQSYNEKQKSDHNQQPFPNSTYLDKDLEVNSQPNTRLSLTNKQHSLSNQKSRNDHSDKKESDFLNTKLVNTNDKMQLQVPMDLINNQATQDLCPEEMYINTLDNCIGFKNANIGKGESQSKEESIDDDMPPEIERSQQPEVKQLRKSSTEASIRQSLNQIPSKSFLDKATDKFQLNIPTLQSNFDNSETLKNKYSEIGSPKKLELIESNRHRRAESAVQIVASSSKKGAINEPENIHDVIDNIDEIDQDGQLFRQNSRNDMRAASGTRNLGLSSRDVESRSGSQTAGSKGFIQNTRAELQSQIKKIKMLEESMRQQKGASINSFVRNNSNTSQDRELNSFRSQKKGNTVSNDNGSTHITPVKILSKVPASVLEQRGSRPSPQGRHNEKIKYADFSKSGAQTSSAENGRQGFSAFSSKAKGFSLVCEDLQKQIITFQNLTKKAQNGGVLKQNYEERSQKGNQSGHAENNRPTTQSGQPQQPYLDDQDNFDPEKKSFDLSENKYGSSMYLNRKDTEQRIGEHLPRDMADTIQVNAVSGPSTLDKFEESHYSWRSALPNQTNKCLKNQASNINNDNSKFLKDGCDDTASFIEPADNVSVSASVNNYGGNLNNQSSFSNFGKPPSSSFNKNLESIQAYKSKIQALKEKEKNRQRQRSQNRHISDNDSRSNNTQQRDDKDSRSRSKSQTIRNIQKYTQELNRQREQQKGRQGSGHQQKSTNSQQRSISPYQRWKMMPRQIQTQNNNQKPTSLNNQKSIISTKNPYVHIQASTHSSNPVSHNQDVHSNQNQEQFTAVGNPKNHRILQQFQESRGQFPGSNAAVTSSNSIQASSYKVQSKQPLSSKYQYSHYIIDHQSSHLKHSEGDNNSQSQSVKQQREDDLIRYGIPSSSSSLREKPTHPNQYNNINGNVSHSNPISSTYVRNSHQERIVSGGESIPGATLQGRSHHPPQISTSGYQSHMNLKQQISKIKQSAGTNQLSTPSSATFSQLNHHPLRNNFLDCSTNLAAPSDHISALQAPASSTTHQNQLLLQSQGSGNSHKSQYGAPGLGFERAQAKIYDQQRKLQQRKQVSYEMMTGSTKSHTIHSTMNASNRVPTRTKDEHRQTAQPSSYMKQSVNSQQRYSGYNADVNNSMPEKGKDSYFPSSLRSCATKKDHYNGRRRSDDEETSSDDIDAAIGPSGRQIRSGAPLGKTFGTVGDGNQAKSNGAYRDIMEPGRRGAATSGLVGSRLINHHEALGVVTAGSTDDFNDREHKQTKPGHTLIQQQYSRQNTKNQSKVEPTPPEAMSERRMRQNFTLEQYKRKMGTMGTSSGLH